MGWCSFDDGIDGSNWLITPLSYAFTFSAGPKSLKQRGLLLAICSKNNLENVLHVFDASDIHLSKFDFVSIKANYIDKVQNIVDIQKHLDIGFDSIVFLDDSPFERNHVRSLLPSILVPELPDDICDFLEYLTSLNLFESFSLSDEDVTRTEMYQARSMRLDLSNTLSFEDYLVSLNMSMEVCSSTTLIFHVYISFFNGQTNSTLQPNVILWTNLAFVFISLYLLGSFD